MERPCNGGGGSWNPVNIISDAVSSVGDALADIDPGPAIGQAGAEVDNFVNREIPGGWVTVGVATAAVAAPFLAPALTEGAVATSAADAAAALEAAAAAEGATTAGMVAAANTGLPAGTTTLGSLGTGAFTGATETGLATLAGEGAVADTVGTSLLAGGEGAVSQAAPIFDYSTEAMLTPGGNVVPATTLPTEMAAMDAEIARAGAEASKTLSTSDFNRARALASALTGGQQNMSMPNMQMPAFEQFGGLYRGNQMPFLTQQTVQQMPMQQTTNFLKELAGQGQTNDLATLLRNI